MTQNSLLIFEKNPMALVKNIEYTLKIFTILQNEKKLGEDEKDSQKWQHSKKKKNR